MMLLLIFSPRVAAQYCATPQPVSTPTTLLLDCNDMYSGSLQTNANKFAPLPDDDLKTVRLRFIFLQRPGDEEAGIGGFHLSNPTHLKYWNDVVGFMNWVLDDNLLLTGDGAGLCAGTDNDTRIRVQVEMVNMEDAFYWNNENNAGLPYGVCPNCPNDLWYLNPLQEQYYNNEGCEHRINIFFTENATEYQKAVTNPIDAGGHATFTACGTDCSLYPTPFADDGDGLELRIHMLDEYMDYLAQKLCIKGNGPCDLTTLWDDSEYAFLDGDWQHNRYLWQVQNTARLILHELGHSFGLPHTDESPYWPFQNTACNLMCTSDMVRNTLYTAQQKAMHKAFSTLNCERYIEGCPYSPNHPIEITGTETWTNEIRLYSDLIVRTGAKLTIKCILHMPPTGRIIVERGAKLIVDGGTITDTGCECERWAGIEVWGNSLQLHKDYIDPAGAFTGEGITTAVAPLSNYENAVLNGEAPGVVVLKNDAILENGFNGITTQRHYGYFPEYYGGIVVAENAHFINCKRGVEFMQYKPTNYSRFKNCTFEATLPISNFAGISIRACRRIIVDNCTFHYVPTTLPASCFGIEAFDARKLLVRNGCDFSHLKQGIKLGSSTTTTATIGTDQMNPNIFDQLTTGILSIGRNSLVAENNQFTGTPTGMPTGIFLSGTHNQYYIHNNTFDALYRGVVANATGQNEVSDNNIECNTFGNCRYGIHAGEQNKGLQFYDNQFQTTVADVRVRNGLSTNGSLQDVQGWVNADDNIIPFFNFFTTDRPLNRVTTMGTTDLFWYYYHTDPEYTDLANDRLVPQCYIGDDCGFSYNYLALDVILPDGYSYKGCLNPYVDEESPAMAPPDACQSRECYEALRTQISTLRNEIDGGDTEGLLVSLSAAPTAQTTYQQLMAVSPYLSDDLLKAIAYNELMPLGWRSNILIANAPLSDNMMNIAYEQLSSASYQVLYTIKYYLTLSERDRLNMRISSENDRKEEWLRQLLDKYSDEKNYSDMESLLNAENTLFALRTLVNAKIDQGDWEAAQTIVNNLPADTPEEQDYQTVQQINLQRLSSDETFALSEEQEATLYNIANAYGHQAPAAQTILTLLKGAQFDWVISDDEADESGKTDTKIRYPKAELSNLKALKQLLINPNPMGETATLLLPPFDLGQAATLQVFDVSGNLVQSQSLPANAATATIEAKDLRNGMYIVALQADGVVLSQSKLIVQH